MAKAAQNTDLAEAFTAHQQESKEQLGRIEEILAAAGMKPERDKCKGIEGIILEGEEHMKWEGEAAVKDAALIASG